VSDVLVELAGFLLGALVIGIPVSCVVYLIWAGARRVQKDRSAPAYIRRSVRFHGVWGMVLSLPLVVAGVSIILEPGVDWEGLLVLAAGLACWAVAIAAMLRRRVPAALTWLPLVVTIVTLALLPSGATTWREYLDWLLLYSLAGIGLAAWVMVSVNFALAVRKDARVGRPEPVARAVVNPA
jgi:hypothetical protein